MHAKIELPEKYRLGVDEIDQQHTEIIAIISDIMNTIAKKDQMREHNKCLRDTIDRLREYSRYHFDYEEKKMRQINYGFSQKHIEEHKKIIEFINSIDFKEKKVTVCFKKEIQLDPKKSSYEQLKDIVNFCQTWYLNHILGHDKMLAESIIKVNKQKNQGL